ncbi:MAG: hypothetical protein PHV11_06985 [Candidatus Bipolaricaulis sp.]|nr:hypothetical protein [Candidatus Bipolaricaulis sp.]
MIGSNFLKRIDDNVHLSEEHIHSVQMVRPTGAAGITVTSAGGAWTLGNFSNDIIAAGDVNLPYDLHWVVVSNESANAEYELVFYYGPTDIECARVVFSRSNPTLRSTELHLQSPILPAGSRIRAKLMDSAGGSACGVKVLLHTY